MSAPPPRRPSPTSAPALAGRRRTRSASSPPVLPAAPRRAPARAGMVGGAGDAEGRLELIDVAAIMSGVGFKCEGVQCLRLARAFWHDGLLQASTSRHGRGAQKRTALMWASYTGDLDRLRYCQSHGADPNQRDASEERISALHWAVLGDQAEAAGLLLDGPPPRGGAAAGVAAGAGAAAPVPAAAADDRRSRKAQLELKDEMYGATALHWAAFQGATRTALLLLDRGADIRAHSRYGGQPLSLACWQHRDETALALLARGAPAEHADAGGMTGLMHAAGSGACSLVEALLAGGAGLESRESQGLTPLLVAANAGELESTSLLLSRGANVNARDSDFDSALHMAASHAGPQGAKLVRLLLEAGAEVDARNLNGATALTLAASHGSAGAALLILATGRASVAHRDRDGGSPLSLACQRRASFEKVSLAMLDAAAAGTAARTQYRDTAPLETVIELEALAKYLDRRHASLLIFCCQTRQAAAAKRLLALGAKADIKPLPNSGLLTARAYCEATLADKRAGHEPEAGAKISAAERRAVALRKDMSEVLALIEAAAQKM